MYLLIFLVFHSVSFSPNHAITFDIIAPYHPIPLFEQFLFFLSDISPFSAKEFLQEILSNYSAIDDTDFLCNLAESYISPSYHQLMYAQIENEYFLPRGEMYRRIALSLDNISDLIISDNSDNLTFSYNEQSNKDIQYGSDIKFGSSDIYVYANLHNKTIAEEILLMITSKASFVLRPFSRSKSTSTKLSGFGFELSINNDKQCNNSFTEFPSDDYSKYKMVTDETIGRLDGIPPSYINPILYQRLGPKMANYLRKHNGSLPELLRDISSNYPLFMPLILSSLETKEDQISFQKVSNLLDLKPFSMSFINGHHVQFGNTDLFNLFDIIHYEHNLNAILERKYKIDSNTIDEITKTQMIPTDDLILDYESPYIIYLNNLETDAQYENWTTDINELYNMTSKFPQIKKNLLNFILYSNPTTQEGANSIYDMVLMMQRNYPSRFGFMPFFNLGDKFERKVAYAFSFFATQNPIAAIQYLINVYERAGINLETNKLNQINKKDFKYVFNEMAKSSNSEITWDMLFFLFDSESPETQRLIETYQYMKKRGIDKQTILLNGRYIQSPSFSPSVLNIEFHAAFLVLQTLFTKYNIRSLDNFDMSTFLKRTMTLIQTIDQRIYFTLPRGIDIYNKKLSTQVEFVDFLPKINWNYDISTESDSYSSFIWIFGPMDTNLTIFNKYLKSSTHLDPLRFSFNPPIPESVIRINKSIITLIFNGRVYENANINDYEFLENLESWSHTFISQPLSPLYYSLKYKRTECMIYLSCIFADWTMNGVSRGKIGDEIWRINSSLIYNPKSRSESIGLTWEMIIDPFSRDFQKIAPIINYFDKRKILDFRLVLVPPIEITTQMNVLTSFYRMSIGDEKTCVFTLLNETSSYSVIQHLPKSWLIENLRTSFDMSNLCINCMKNGIHSSLFTLSSIVIDGRCFTEFGDVAEFAEISVFDKNHIKKDTTIVMKMNGYWQLKVDYPGQFLFDISGVKTKLIFQKVALNFLMGSFNCPFIRFEVNYNPSFAHYQVKDISRFYHRSKKRYEDCLNIFSVSDGFESEDRLIKMIISVINNTKSSKKIKFWFIKSLVSPQFKVILKKLKEKYSINYYFTDYKWPIWLKSQPARSNYVLAYKILFLDLLFKDEKGRVLYMDPYNCVQKGTDLFNLFLTYSFFGKGNHYSTTTFAFPDFSDTRAESESLRFWKNDYWLSFLQGKPYLNTNLFLLDLKRFKESGYAELLRYIYQIMPADPTSQSALDQNIINFIQLQMPIKVLPNDYHGSDLWNDDLSMENVKIVHLSDNPISNLSEFDRASKYIKGWSDIQRKAQEIMSD